jgi:hypothetical protein
MAAQAQAEHCLCASVGPGHAEALLQPIVFSGIAREGIREAFLPFLVYSHGSPGTSSMHCPCALVGLGHAEAQANSRIGPEDIQTVFPPHSYLFLWQPRHTQRALPMCLVGPGHAQAQADALPVRPCNVCKNLDIQHRLITCVCGLVLPSFVPGNPAEFRGRGTS